MRALGILILLGSRALVAGAADAVPAPVFTAAQMRADLAEVDRALHEMPADLAHSVDEKDLARTLRELDARLAGSPPLTRDQAWREFATLNPLLADGHLFVGFVDWRGDTRAHLASGGRLFPLPVRVSPDCELRAHGDVRILAVNGLSAEAACEQMLARMHGDTRAFRADLLSRRFWFFHWKVFGAPETYEIILEGSGKQVFAGGARLPDLLAAEEKFDRQFRLTMIADRENAKPAAAILTLGSFAWPDKDQVLAFTRQSFETLRREKIRTLVIDLRDNGGGNDDQWIEGVMPYIATKPFRTASTYRKREMSGAAVTGEIATWYPPQPGNPARFRGQIYVAVSAGTYSSAVVMSTVIQDFGFGKVVGPGGSVRAGQSGGTRRTTLTNTGLIVVAPRFVLTRPSGAKQPVLFAPDLATLPPSARIPP